ncbi:hypothetical protein [Clostridium estertheticum]|uniref:hypothetical protein n=1 Tax=Clostridium estertheticum TaxID=238834 RepID=UPI001C0B5C77|nr:hypothetical protein [Clostridium estertheticum]MBU3173402.1 hypothetical protein [Clostridium estertheticum]
MIITDNQLEQIKKIEGSTRKEAMQQVSNIIQAEIYDQFRMSGTSKCLRINEYIIDITTKKIKNGNIVIREIDVINEKNIKDWTIYDGIN